MSLPLPAAWYNVNPCRGRRTVQTQFPLGLSKMYGPLWKLGQSDPKWCHHSTNLLSQYLHSLVILLSQPPLVHITCATLNTHIYVLHMCTHQNTHTFPHHCDLSSPVEWAVPSYLVYLLHPPIYYWCNGALYLNAALPATTTSAQREPGHWLRASTGFALGQVSEEMDEWLGRWLSWAWTWPDTDNCGKEFSPH